MTIVTQEQFQQYREENTREIEMPDGTKRSVRMSSPLWNSLEFLEAFEEVTEADLAAFALEEMQLQDVTFDRAFRGVVAYFANRWQ